MYGSDAVGGVINFITRKDFQEATITLGADSSQHPNGKVPVLILVLVLAI